MRIEGRNLPHRGEIVVVAFADELAQARSEWWTELLTPGAADRERAEGAVATLYERAGRPRPEVVRLDSPLALVRAAAGSGGVDVTADTVYRRFERELDILAGLTRKPYRFRGHLLAALQAGAGRRSAVGCRVRRPQGGGAADLGGSARLRLAGLLLRTSCAPAAASCSATALRC